MSTGSGCGRRQAGAMLLLALAGCAPLSSSPRLQPTPLRGQAPRRVAVWPWLDAAHGGAADLLLADLDPALRQWGYDTMALAVGRQLLHDAGLSPAADDPARSPAAVRAALAVDAVLCLDVRQFDVDDPERPRTARWDLAWRLVGTADGRELWRYENHGGWSRAAQQPFDPLTRLDDDALHAVPIGGDGTQQFANARDLVRALHQAAFARLPRGTR